MRLVPGGCFGVCFGMLGHVFFPGSVVGVLFCVFFGVVMGEMVFESDE
jgi:hypothetical protein